MSDSLLAGLWVPHTKTGRPYLCLSATRISRRGNVTINRHVPEIPEIVKNSSHSFSALLHDGSGCAKKKTCGGGSGSVGRRIPLPRLPLSEIRERQIVEENSKEISDL